jgi:hypothetical protein
MDVLNKDHLLNVEELEIDDQASGSLYSMAKWANFLAIVIFVFGGLLLIIVLALLGKNPFNQFTRGLDRLLGYNVDATLYFGAGLLVVLCIIGVVGYFLLNFGKKTKVALVSENIEVLNQGLKSLKISFMLYGIIAILGLLSSLLIIVKMF